MTHPSTPGYVSASENEKIGMMGRQIKKTLEASWAGVHVLLMLDRYLP